MRAPLVLLTATGARGGAPHTTPADLPGRRRPAADARLQRGADTNPAWYHNVLADPEVTVEQGTDTYTATATPVGGAERGRLSAHQAGLIPVYAQYQAMTTRRIPAVELRRQTND